MWRLWQQLHGPVDNVGMGSSIERDFPGINDPYYGLSSAERDAWARGGAKGLLEQLLGPTTSAKPVEQAVPPKNNQYTGKDVAAPGTAKIEAPLTALEVRNTLMKMNEQEFGTLVNEVSYGITRLMDNRRAIISQGMWAEGDEARRLASASTRADAEDRKFRASMVFQGVSQEIKRRYNTSYETGAHGYPGWFLTEADRTAVKDISAQSDDRSRLARYGITGKFADGIDPVAVFIRDYR